MWVQRRIATVVLSVTMFGRMKNSLLMDVSIQILGIGLCLVVLIVIGCRVGGLVVVGACFVGEMFGMAHRIVDWLQK